MKHIDLKMFSLNSIFFVTIIKMFESFLLPLFIIISSQVINEIFSRFILGPIFFFIIGIIAKNSIRNEYKIKSTFQLIKKNKLLTTIIIFFSLLINFGSSLILNNLMNTNFFIEIFITPLVFLLYLFLSVCILFSLIDKISYILHF